MKSIAVLLPRSGVDGTAVSEAALPCARPGAVDVGASMVRLPLEKVECSRALGG
jgi:hypothetical protein